MGRPSYEVVVIGDGPAGATAALYTTRLGHATAVVDRGGGRHTAVEHVHNVYGVSEDVSGRTLSRLAREQLAAYGADCYSDDVRRVVREDDGFAVRVEHHDLRAERVVLATGFRDVPPEVDGLTRYAGRGLHYCLHCDAYGLIDEPVYVLGDDEYAAEVAMIMCNFTADVDLLPNGDEPAWGDDVGRQLEAHPLRVIETEVVEPYDETPDDDEPRLGGLRFADGSSREYTGGFAMHGSEYNSELADDVGCELADDGSVEVDAEGRTSVDGVYAVGDLTHGQNQTVVAAGDGALAGIALHKELRRFPLAEDGAGGSHAGGTAGADPEDVTAPAVPEAVRARAAAVRDAETLPGLVPRDRPD